MSRVLAIDPGNRESAYVVIDDDLRPRWHGKIPNADLLASLAVYRDAWAPGVIAVEMVASYGMAVGKDVFETCVAIGRIAERAERVWPNKRAALVYRRDVKMHHCHSAKAKDSNIRQALVDRFASGQPNHGKGTKAEPGWFYGFRADIWAAYALAVYVADFQRGAVD